MSINRTLTLSWLLRYFYSWIPASARHYLFNWFLWFQKSSGYQSMKRKHFVGLKNQGATCYLNTLLQTWFMTQEVKECITSYKEQDSLTCELCSLFERLSNGNERSLSTVQLTSQLKLNVYKQRDIAECFRSLVNNLNSKMDQEHNILKIYQSTMVNSLKCLKCTQSTDEDTFFLDIPLSVCSANAAEKFDFMEKSLKQFLKEEKMEGDNKCYCTNCEMKTETSSRYYFKHLPQILTFQLKRFEFDYNYMTFQKITDCITVPPGLEFTRSQDFHNEWCVQFTVNKVNNAQNNSLVDVVKDEETPVQHQEVNRGDSVVFTGRNPETPQDHSQQVATGQEVNNAQNDSLDDVVKDEETPVQHQDVNRGDTVVFTGRNSETPQDHSQQVATGQEVNNAQNDSLDDVVKDEETPVQHQEVNRGDTVVFTGRNSETLQDHSQQVATGQEVNNAQNDSLDDVVKDEETPVQHQDVNRGDTVVFTGRNSETPQDHSQQVATGQEVNNAQNDSLDDVVKDEETPVQHQDVNRGDTVVFTGRNSETLQDHSQQVATGQEVNNAQNDSLDDVVKDEETPVQHQDVNRGDTVVFTGRNSETLQDHSQQVATGQEVNNAQNDSLDDVVKDEETPVQHQEVNRGDTVVFTGRNSETLQDHSQQVATGQEVNNAQNDSLVDVVKDEVTPVQHQEVNQEDSEVFTGKNPETPQDHSHPVSTGQQVNNAQNDWHVDDVKDEETADQHQEVNREDSVVFTGRNPETPQDHSQQVSTGQEEKKYELFAIWHHRGSYGSGHYYAEIKSDSGDWYNFNDENVEQKMDINLSSKTAYVLMYRPINTNPKAELPAGVSKKPVDESEKGKPVLSLMMEKPVLRWVMRMPGWVMKKLKLGWVMRMPGWVMKKLKLGWVMRMLGWVMKKLKLGWVMRMLGWVMKKLKLSWVMKKLKLGWVMKKLKLGWVMPVEGEANTPPVEGEAGSPPVEGEDGRHSTRQTF
ncbi:uncharacterized protein [Hemitrygon akajei]|uniref:uncharacterized protein isoform X3 n=1 Tax=Hemitrygon akajei TaxID=2704970 RepID=UPI003BF9BCF9